MKKDTITITREEYDRMGRIIDELERLTRKMEDERDALRIRVLKLEAERDALKARVAELEGAEAELKTYPSYYVDQHNELKLVRKELKTLKARRAELLKILSLR